MLRRQACLQLGGDAAVPSSMATHFKMTNLQPGLSKLCTSEMSLKVEACWHAADDQVGLSVQLRCGTIGDETQY